jgi:hypothetical protein
VIFGEKRRETFGEKVDKNNAHTREEEEAKKNAPLEQSISLPLSVCVCCSRARVCVRVRVCVCSCGARRSLNAQQSESAFFVERIL